MPAVRLTNEGKGNPISTAVCISRSSPAKLPNSAFSRPFAPLQLAEHVRFLHDDLTPSGQSNNATPSFDPLSPHGVCPAPYPTRPLDRSDERLCDTECVPVAQEPFSMPAVCYHLNVQRPACTPFYCLWERRSGHQGRGAR